MDDRRIGQACRALRIKAGWRQSDPAARVGCHQSTISRIERGDTAGLTVDTLRRIFAALSARYEPNALWREGELDRLLDARHADLVEAGAAEYRAAAWLVFPEVSFNHFGDRGSVDLLAGHPATRAVAVNEMKSEIVSVEETGRRHDVKVRLAATLAEERLGWTPRFVGRTLIVPEDRTIRRNVERHGTVFDAM